MNKNKLRQIYDKSYDETFGQIVRVVKDEDRAKELIGKIYQETLRKMPTASKTIKDIKELFEQTKTKYGIC